MKRYRYKVWAENVAPRFFESAPIVGEFVGTCAALVTQACKSGTRVNGWIIEREEVTTNKKVVGIDPDGHKVLFESLRDATEKLDTTEYTLSNAVYRRKECGGWKWCFDNVYLGERDFTPWKEEMRYTFTPRGKTRRTPNTWKWNYLERNCENEDISHGRKPIAVGSYDPEMNTCFCPICKKYIPNQKSSAHLNKCLEGREFQLRFGIIKVYS